MSKFKEVKIKDNFYQSSSFFPMPCTLIGTLDESGEYTTFGAYSLIFPYYIAGKGYYAMVLECRNSSNTCKGLLRHGKCTINFLPHSKKNFKITVENGFPGDTPEEKLKNFKLKVEEGQSALENPSEKYPKIISDALQVFECTWVRELDGAENDTVQEEYLPPYHDFNGITSQYGAHFILKIDHILVKEKYHDALVDGVTRRNFCPLPTNWGYRDSKYFWCSGYRKPIAVGVPNKEVDLTSLRYAASRLNTDVTFTDDALKTLGSVPRAFLKIILQACVKWADERNIKVVTEEEMEQINSDRKKKKK